MIKQTVVKELVNYAKNDFPVTSAYVSVEKDPGERNTHVVELKKAIRYKKSKTYFKQLSEAEKASVLEDFNKILKYITEEFDTGKYLSAICFSSSENGLWKVIHLKQSIKNELVIQPKPYIRPLTNFFSNHRDYAVVLVDKAKARIFESKYGDYHEFVNIKDPDVETRKVGGFQGTEERKVERSQHQAIINHYKEVAQKSLNLHQKNNFNWIILGGRHDAILEFKKYLHDYVITKVDGEVEVEPSEPINNVLEEIRKSEKKSRQRFEKKLLSSFLEKQNGKLAVKGIESVVKALENGQVSTLIIKEDFSHKGVFCRHDDFISANGVTICPKCGAKTEKTKDIIENLLHKALSQSVEIEYIGSEIDKEKISAMLRYQQAG